MPGGRDTAQREYVHWQDGQPLFREGPAWSRSYPTNPWPDEVVWLDHYRRRRMRLSQLPDTTLRSLALAATDRVIATLDLDLTALD